ncbi:MAG: MBL fold metallo-hydrolase [Nitrospinales bacterium]
MVVLYALLFTGCAQLQNAVQPPVQSSTVKKSSPQPSSFEPDGYYETAPKIPKKGYFLKRLARNVYFFSTGVYNNLFVVTSKGVVITDPIAGKGSLLKRAIREVTPLPVKFMIYSHSHRDHIGDAYMFSQGTQIIAHKETSQLLKRYNDPKRPIPSIAFGNNYTLNFGGLKIELHYPGDGHGRGNIILYIPARKILMYVDVATPKAVPFKNFSTVDIFSQVQGLQKALKFDFETYVAGHLFRPGKKSEMKEVWKYYMASKKANALALKRVSFKKVKAKSRSKDIERIFGEYYEAVAEQCYRILKKNWKQRLMGFEAFARGHCDVWTSFHRTHLAPK